MNIRSSLLQPIKVAIITLMPVALAFVPVISDLNLHERGAEPEKHIGILQESFNQPLLDLARFSTSAEVSLSIGTRKFANLYIVNVVLRNTGKAPILPSDFHEPLSVSVENPWEIVTVENGQKKVQQISLEWKFATPQKFVASPSLINPDDRIAAVIYLTNSDLPPLSVIEGPKQPQLHWNARITNMKSFGVEENQIQKTWNSIFETFGSGIYSILAGKKLVVTFIAGIANMLLLLHLLARFKSLQKYNFQFAIIASAIAAFSAVVAECLATYICGDVITEIMNAIGSLNGEIHKGFGLINAVPIVLNSLLILTLLHWDLLTGLTGSKKQDG